MMEWVKEWWAVIMGFIATIFWLSRIEHILTDLKGSPPMTVKLCEQCREQCRANVDWRFAAGEKQFDEVKTLIAANELSSQRRHDELVHMIVDGLRQ
jgi:hypothetical protein